MEWNQPVVHLIETRTSTRSYDKAEIDESSRQKLCAYLEEINHTVKIHARFVLITAADGGSSDAAPLGTYGMISGARSYILGILDKKEQNAVQFGFLFEKIILTATDLGLKTCWLGGTFKRDDFNKKAALGEEEFIAVVSPAGYRKERPKIADFAIRAAIGANRRKPWEQLFFNETTDTALTKEQAGDFAVPLEMVRIAPSASNKQPWRVIKKGNEYRFFLCRTKGYGSVNFDIQKNDIGIAMCHFELSAKESGRSGDWNTEQKIIAPETWEYIATWTN